ncbi:hypothetical protein ACFV3R_07885 [Streptomyces sp. NPDC059740]|uniref:hypothetical protein n=1 Tax=Streptomyces sp. NPDC059740 TaxID=3346926 RepID=UPI00364E3AFF
MTSTEKVPGSGPARTADAGARTPARGVRRDVVAALAGVALFAAAAVAGAALNRTTYHGSGILRLSSPPLYGPWLPHVGPGTLAAPVVAALVVAYGPPLARRLSWRRLLPAAWAATAVWTFALAMVDGWGRGYAQRLTTRMEYLRSVPAVHDIPATLADFTHHILVGSPHIWPAHVSGHPPGALLTFVLLDRVGLGGGAWAATWCLLTGTSAVAAVLVAVRALCGEVWARRAAPFLVLIPAAVWIGVSADGYFAGVAAWTVALLALSATRTARWPRLAALAAGLLAGLAGYLSYGLTVLVVMVAAVLVMTRTVRPLPYLVLGALPWVLAFTAAGFWWPEGYTTLHTRYYQGAAKVRPYGYFVWADLAAQVPSVGLAALAGLRRAAGPLREGVRRCAAAWPWRRDAATAARPVTGRAALAGLVAAAVCMMLAADLSGMSKAETERIWLPFAVWLPVACALLPRASHRWWLAVQATVALLVNSLLFTGW